VVFLSNPARAWQMLQGGTQELDRLREKGVTPVCLEPWHDTALRQWLEDCQFGPRDSQGRQEIAAATGNWPYLLGELFRRCQVSNRSWAEHLKALDHDLDEPQRAEDLLQALGLEVTGPTRVLIELVRYQELRPRTEELAQLLLPACGLDLSVLAGVLKWADLLRLARESENGWQVDPVAARLLRGRS
jgi:hypothetical protein